MLTVASARSALKSWIKGDGRLTRKELKNEIITAPPGLANLGNTCFMNSVLQCLLNAPGLPLRTIAFDFEDDSTKSRSKLGRAFADMVREYSETERGSLSQTNSALKDMKSAITDLHSQYAGRSQHDAYEFLGRLLEGLQGDFLAVGTIPALCGVTTHTTRECHDCSGVFKVDNVTDVALRLPLMSTAAQANSLAWEEESRHAISVEDLIASASEPEYIDGYDCTTCSETAMRSCVPHTRSSMTQRAGLISESNTVMIVVLCRFYQWQGGDERPVLKKNCREVICQTELALEAGQYSLFGAIGHIGATVSSGHYIANVRSLRDGAWYECDDTSTRPMQLSVLADGRSVCKMRDGADPYILFYRRRDDVLTMRQPKVAAGAQIPNADDSAFGEETCSGNNAPTRKQSAESVGSADAAPLGTCGADVGTETHGAVTATTYIPDSSYSADCNTSIDKKPTKDSEADSICNDQRSIACNPCTSFNRASDMPRVEHRAACLTRLVSEAIQLGYRFVAATAQPAALEHMVVGGMPPLTVADERAFIGAF